MGDIPRPPPDPAVLISHCTAYLERAEEYAGYHRLDPALFEGGVDPSLYSALFPAGVQTSTWTIKDLGIARVACLCPAARESKEFPLIARAIYTICTVFQRMTIVCGGDWLHAPDDLVSEFDKIVDSIYRTRSREFHNLCLSAEAREIDPEGHAKVAELWAHALLRTSGNEVVLGAQRWLRVVVGRAKALYLGDPNKFASHKTAKALKDTVNTHCVTFEALCTELLKRTEPWDSAAIASALAYGYRGRGVRERLAMLRPSAR
jgi:hypothetical protein